MERRQIDITAVKWSVITCSLVFALFTHSASGDMPPGYKALYHVEKYDILIGLSTIKLEKKGKSLLFSQDVELAGFATWFRDDSVKERSWLTEIDGGRYQLVKYQYQQFNSDKNRDVFLERNGALNKFSGTVSGEQFSLEVPSQTWDNFSFQLALMSDASETRGDYDYNVISRGSLKKYEFKSLGEENIEVDDREYKTTIYERADDDSTTKIWLAQDLHFIPVLIEKYVDDDVDTRISLISITIDEDE